MKALTLPDDGPVDERRLTGSGFTDPPSNFRRASGNPLHRAYPWLLLASTAIATAFCLMYITKPVIQVSSDPAIDGASAPARSTATPEQKSPTTIAPENDRLPGDPAVATGPASVTKLPAFEETNLGIQHVLNARIPSGDVSRIVLDVPVLYQSRHLRWTQDDAAAARGLLARLADYQEKSIALKAEGSELLSEWHHLVNRTIPSTELRADSPSLPANQRDASTTNLPAAMDSSDSIKVIPTGK